MSCEVFETFHKGIGRLVSHVIPKGGLVVRKWAETLRIFDFFETKQQESLLESVVEAEKVIRSLDRMLRRVLGV